MATIVTKEVLNYILANTEYLMYSVQLTVSNIVLRPVIYLAVVKITYSDATIKTVLEAVVHNDTLGTFEIAEDDLPGYKGLADDEVQAAALCNSNLPILYT